MENRLLLYLFILHAEFKHILVDNTKLQREESCWDDSQKLKAAVMSK